MLSSRQRGTNTYVSSISGRKYFINALFEAIMLLDDIIGIVICLLIHEKTKNELKFIGNKGV